LEKKKKKHEFGSAFERTISEPCAAENFRKKTPKSPRKIVAVIKTGLFSSLSLSRSLFELLTLKLTKVQQMGFEVPGSQSHKRGDQKPTQWHFISIGLWEEEALNNGNGLKNVG
jgi:hypothetical protein